MAQFTKSYPVMEIAISCVNSQDHTVGKVRRKMGEIITVRKPHHVIGMKEAKDFLWLRVEGLEKKQWNILREFDSGLYKRRYCIPFHRLKEVYPPLDLNRVYDRSDSYQPFCIPDFENDYRYAVTNKPFRTEGLVLDKVTRKYL